MSRPTSQHESGLILDADHHKSLIEANIWGLLFYAYDMLEQLDAQGTAGIHEYSLVGRILVSLEHAKAMYELLGFQGTLLLRTRLEGIRDVPLLFTGGSASRIDNIVEFDVTSTSDRLKTQDRKSVV